jgi:hypothetical protein
MWRYIHWLTDKHTSLTDEHTILYHSPNLFPAHPTIASLQTVFTKTSKPRRCHRPPRRRCPPACRCSCAESCPCRPEPCDRPTASLLSVGILCAGLRSINAHRPRPASTHHPAHPVLSASLATAEVVVFVNCTLNLSKFRCNLIRFNLNWLNLDQIWLC